MRQQDDDAITIKLNIRIPFNGQKVEVDGGEHGELTYQSDPIPISIKSIDFPAAGQPHPVKRVGSGPTEF